MRRGRKSRVKGPGGNTPGLLRASGVVLTPVLAPVLIAVLLGVLGAAQPVSAQTPTTAAPATAAPARSQTAAVPVLTLDFERLFEASRWGKRIAADLASASAVLNDENNRIADDLIAEEKALTERRASLAPEQFRTEADAFDERATAIRNAQKAKAQSLSQGFDAARQAFFDAVAPLIDEVLALRGAAVVLDQRVVIRGLAQADITEELVQRADARLGDGPAR